MATKRTTTPTVTLRRCIGSATFGIPDHEAAIEDFPVQPSRRDGLGLMCREHWTVYTRSLRRAARERTTAVPEHNETLTASLVGEGTPIEAPVKRSRRRAVTEEGPAAA